MRKVVNNSTGTAFVYFLLSIGVVVVALTGFRVFVAFRQAPFPSTFGIGMLALAAAAGFASLFSPCSFPLLLTLLSREGVDTAAGTLSARRLIRFALVFSIGSLTFLLLTGAVMALGAAPIMARITFTSPAGRLLRLFTGVVLIGIGWRQFQGRSFNAGWLNSLLQPLWRAEARLRHRRSTLRIGLYGFGYILAGFG